MTRSQQRAPNTSRARLQDLNTVFAPAPTADAPTPHEPAGRAPASPVATVRIRRGPGAGQRFVLPATTSATLGRHPSCDIVLSNVTVSRRHAEIRLTADGFMLRDLGSLNGTYLNAKPADTAVLADGDDIAVGVFRLTFHASEHINPT